VGFIQRAPLVTLNGIRFWMRKGWLMNKKPLSLVRVKVDGNTNHTGECGVLLADCGVLLADVKARDCGVLLADCGVLLAD